MASENAKAVAQDVKRNIRNHKKVDLGEIILNRGYSPSVAKAPQLVTQTKSYQDIISPTVKRMERVRDKAIVALDKRDMTGEETRDLTTLIKNLNHDILLMTGKPTERTETDNLHKIAIILKQIAEE